MSIRHQFLGNVNTCLAGRYRFGWENAADYENTHLPMLTIIPKHDLWPQLHGIRICFFALHDLRSN
jgi:hypothetical protein